VEGDRRPTNSELSHALKMAKKFKYFSRGKVVVLDKEHEQQIVAIIEFTPLDELTPEEFDDLGTVSKFLHRCKDFFNPVSSDTRSWGGKDVGGGVEEVYGRLQASWNVRLPKKSSASQG
jgi:hypothetical protein